MHEALFPPLGFADAVPSADNAFGSGSLRMGFFSSSSFQLTYTLFLGEAFSHDRIPEFLNFATTDIWGQIILGGGRLPCVL